MLPLTQSPLTAYFCLIYFIILVELRTKTLYVQYICIGKSTDSHKGIHLYCVVSSVCHIYLGAALCNTLSTRLCPRMECVHTSVSWNTHVWNHFRQVAGNVSDLQTVCPNPRGGGASITSLFLFIPSI